MIYFLPEFKREKLFEASMLSSLDITYNLSFVFGEKMDLTPVSHKERPRLGDSVVLHAERVWISYVVFQLLSIASLQKVLS